MPDVTFVVSDVTGAEESEKLERALTRLEFVDLVNVDSERGLVAVSYEGGEEELGKVSVVGTGMLNRPGYAARMFATLGEAGIPIRLVSTSEIQVTCVMPAGRVEEAVRVLHRDFELEERDV